MEVLINIGHWGMHFGRSQISVVFVLKQVRPSCLFERVVIVVNCCIPTERIVDREIGGTFKT